MNSNFLTLGRRGAKSAQPEFGVELAHGGMVAAFEFAGQQHFVFGTTIHLGRVGADEGFHRGGLGDLFPTGASGVRPGRAGCNGFFHAGTNMEQSPARASF